MKYAYVMIGLPGIGKSTFVDKQKTFHVFSTDNRLMSYAESEGKTYNEVFDRFGDAMADELAALNEVTKNEKQVLFDRTNMTKAARKKCLSWLPKGYSHQFCHFLPPQNEQDYQGWRARLASRAGKTIPESVLINMANSFETTPENCFNYDMFGNFIRNGSTTSDVYNFVRKRLES